MTPNRNTTGAGWNAEKFGGGGGDFVVRLQHPVVVVELGGATRAKKKGGKAYDFTVAYCKKAGPAFNRGGGPKKKKPSEKQA